MRLLLDTHALLWWFDGTLDERAVIAAGAEEAEEFLVSVLAFAEIGIKAATGKMGVQPDLRERVQSAGIRLLPLSPEHGLGVAQLPMHHRDPFDRLLISQARHEGLAILTADRRFAAYDVATLPISRRRPE